MADEGDPDRDAILKRRRRFVALALGGALAAQGAACGEPDTPSDAGRPRDSATPTPCLSFPGPDAARPDAANPLDGGSDGGAPRDGGRDSTVIGLDGSFPMPCLSMVPPDSGAEES